MNGQQNIYIKKIIAMTHITTSMRISIMGMRIFVTSMLITITSLLIRINHRQQTSVQHRALSTGGQALKSLYFIMCQY